MYGHETRLGILRNIGYAPFCTYERNQQPLNRSIVYSIHSVSTVYSHSDHTVLTTLSSKNLISPLEENANCHPTNLTTSYKQASYVDDPQNEFRSWG